MPTKPNVQEKPKTTSEKPKGVSLRDDAFTIIDENARYQFKNNKIYIEVEFPKQLKDVITKDLLSTSGKTFRVYSNSTKRKFIKNAGFKDVQLQINGYISVKDIKVNEEIPEDVLELIKERTKK